LGLIFYIGETSSSFFSSYLSLTLVDGFIQFTVKIDMNSTAVLLKSKIRIDDGRWHRIEIERYSLFIYYTEKKFRDCRNKKSISI